MAEIIEIIGQPPEVSLVEVVTYEPVVTVLGPPGTTNVILARYTFTTPSLSWPIVHNKQTTFFHLKLLREDGKLLIAPFSIESENEIIIHFTCPTAGYADVVFSYGLVEGMYNVV